MEAEKREFGRDERGGHCGSGWMAAMELFHEIISLHGVISNHLFNSTTRSYALSKSESPVSFSVKRLPAKPVVAESAEEKKGKRFLFLTLSWAERRFKIYSKGGLAAVGGGQKPLMICEVAM
jgi:hypothetical protein